VHKYSDLRAVLILDEGAPEFSLVDPFYTEQLRNDLLVNVLLPGGCGWASYRHLPVAPIPAKVTHAYVEQATRGDLSSFQWLQGPIRSAVDAGQRDKHICHIYYSSLNFKDVMTATGKLTMDVFYPNRLHQDSLLGLEFSGRDPSGMQSSFITKKYVCVSYKQFQTLCGQIIQMSESELTENNIIRYIVV
jgi:fatty acid synthase